MLTEAQEKKNIDGRSGALISKAEEGFSTNSANDWYSMTSSDWADEVCEFDREESYRVQQMFDAIDTILYETDDMLIGESKFPVQRSNECSTFPLGKNVSKVSQYLWQNNGVILDPAIKTLSSVSHNKATAIQGSLRPKQMFAGVEHLLSECKEWASKFPHLRIRGAGITAAERTSSAARKAITFTPRTLSKTVTGKGPNIPELHRSGYALETSELGKPLINGALTNQVSPGLNTPGYMPHLLIRGQQLSPRMPQTLAGMHLTTWSQHPRKISSGRHSAPKSTRPCVTQHSKVRSLLTDDLAIARVGSCSYAADTTTTVKLARRILSTPDPRSRTLNLLTRSKTETSRLSGRSRLSPVESASPGPRTPTDGKQNWRTGDQFNLHSKDLRVKSEQSTRKLRLARSVQKLSELTSDNPPQHAVHLNTVSDIKAVLKEEILSILCADAAAALFAIASGKAAQSSEWQSRLANDIIRTVWNPVGSAIEAMHCERTSDNQQVFSETESEECLANVGAEHLEEGDGQYQSVSEQQEMNTDPDSEQLLLNQKVAEFRDQRKQLAEGMEVLPTNVNERSKPISRLETENMALNIQIQEIQQELSAAKSELRVMKGRLERSEIKELRENLSAMSKSCSPQQQKVAEMEQLLSVMKEQLRTEQEKSQAAVRDFRIQSRKLRDCTLLLDQKNMASLQLEENFKKLEAAHEKLKLERDVMEDEIAKFKVQRRALSRDLESLSETNEKLEREVNRLRLKLKHQDQPTWLENSEACLSPPNDLTSPVQLYSFGLSS
nr:unnamed protein product [Spirometra erinaceieuropaei]